MFCPHCGVLSFPDSRGWITCTDYKCGYSGPLSGEDGAGGVFTDPMTGEGFSLSSVVSSVEATDLSRHDSPVQLQVRDLPVMGVMGVACRACDSTNTIASSSMRRASSRDHSQHYQCNDCNHKWMER